jgi:hypothetical protein
LIFALGDAGATAALLIGDVEAATAFVDEHRRLCEERGERGYLIRAQEFLQALLRIERTGVADPAAASLVAPGSRSPVLAKPQLSARIAEAVGRSRSPKEGLAALETVSAYAGGARGFIGPELMRVRASLLMMSGAPSSEVEALLRRALERASQLGLLTFELRIVTTLAEVLAQMGRASEARALLADIIDRMPEGHGAADYRRAKSLKRQISVQGV